MVIHTDNVVCSIGVKETPFHPYMMILGGLLVGIGTRLGSGCTSGHGLAGIARVMSVHIFRRFEKQL